METLYRKLKSYETSDYYGFHMPGHKRNTERFPEGIPYGIDITEIEGFDDLHHADGILKESQERASRIYGAEETRFLVNGSTVGILSAILGCTRKGDTILVARNCHKSVYHAMYMNELNPVYLYPGFRPEVQLNTEISVSAVKTALNEHSKIKAVVMVSPTYDGVVSDIEGIAREVHKAGIPLIVDEAHGAHFGFHPYFPKSALSQGADVVIHSLHKTLPSLTQTALLHINGTLADKKRIYQYLDMLQSSSPSYILMASIGECIRMLEEERETLFTSYVEELKKAEQALEGMKHLQVIRTEHFDHSKLVISSGSLKGGGKELSRRLLEEYHLQMEMSAGRYVIAMTSPGDTKEGFQRLVKALLEMDERMEFAKETELPDVLREVRKPEIVCTCARAVELADETGNTVFLKWKESVGHISTEYAYLYPPGSPIVVPGERIDEETVRLLESYHRMGFSIEGPEQEGYMKVLVNG